MGGRFQRVVGVFVAVAAVSAGALLWFAVVAVDPSPAGGPRQVSVFGLRDVLYDSRAPYGARAAAKALPKVHVAGRRGGRSRAETRSIHPDDQP